MKETLTDYKILGFRTSNKSRTSNVYMIRECDNCHAILEFASNEVSSEIKDIHTYHEYIKCPICQNKVTVLESKNKD